MDADQTGGFSRKPVSIRSGKLPGHPRWSRLFRGKYLAKPEADRAIKIAL